MKILGIDYGRAKIGLALSFGSLAEPYAVYRFESEDKFIKNIAEVVKKEKVERIVLGLPEGELGPEVQKVGQEISSKLKIEVDFQDEGLSTQDAQRLSIVSGMKRKKRKRLEDAFAAAVILQDYLWYTFSNV